MPELANQTAKAGAMRDAEHGRPAMNMIGYAKAGGERGGVFRLLAATVGMLAIFPISAQTADDLKPPAGYRGWFHVNTMIVDKSSPLFEVLGGMHNVHVNSVGESALRKGDRKS